MPTSRIVSITPDGTYQSAYGLLHQQKVAFEDGTVGQANAKSPTPPYRVGDIMDYLVTGSYPGGQKLKITKPQLPQLPQTPNPTPIPAPQPPKPTTLPPPTSRTAPEGQTIGMAVKLAGDVLMHNARCEGKPVDLASLSGHLWEVAGAIIEACDGLKTGVKPTDALPF